MSIAALIRRTRSGYRRDDLVMQPMFIAAPPSAGWPEICIGDTPPGPTNLLTLERLQGLASTVDTSRRTYRPPGLRRWELRRRHRAHDRVDGHDRESAPDGRSDPRRHKGLRRGRDGPRQARLDIRDPGGRPDRWVRVQDDHEQRSRDGWQHPARTRRSGRDEGRLPRLLEPLLRGEMAGNEARELDRLKARLEATTA